LTKPRRFNMTCIMREFLCVTLCTLFVSLCVDGQTSYRTAGTKTGNESAEYGNTRVNITVEMMEAIMNERCVKKYLARSRKIMGKYIYFLDPVCNTACTPQYDPKTDKGENIRSFLGTHNS
jgi:hypothetical protein